MHLRSNQIFKEVGLKKKIAYQISLSTSRNPDFVVHHPNETKEKNPANWKKDITTRVTHEEELRQNVLKVRLAKQTSYRRMNKE